MVAASAVPHADLRALVYGAAVARKMRRDRDPWRTEARPEQVPPPGDWTTWLLLAGRGFGKTRTAMEWVRERATGTDAVRIAVVGATANDTRRVMVEGESGLLAVCARYGIALSYRKSSYEIDFPNGSKALMYSADEPDRLRGAQHHYAAADELAAWRYPDAWDQLQFGLRLGTHPRQVVATTPRPKPLMRDLLAAQRTPDNPDGPVVVTRGSTYDNAANLAPSFLATVIRKYEGTRTGRQELLAELLEDVPGALWTLAQIEAHRAPAPAPDDLVRIVVGVDPAASDGGDEDSAETGIVVVGRHWNGHGYVLEDATVRGTPYRWGSAVVAAYDRWQADAIVAEANQGGAMVERTIRSVWEGAPVTLVHASRGKLTRAEPVASLAEQGRIHHAGAFPALEDQLTTYDGSGASPDRLDAYVWAATDLLVGQPPTAVDPAIVAAFGAG